MPDIPLSPCDTANQLLILEKVMWGLDLDANSCQHVRSSQFWSYTRTNLIQCLYGKDLLQLSLNLTFETIKFPTQISRWTPHPKMWSSFIIYSTLQFVISNLCDCITYMKDETKMFIHEEYNALKWIYLFKCVCMCVSVSWRMPCLWQDVWLL